MSRDRGRVRALALCALLTASAVAAAQAPPPAAGVTADTMPASMQGVRLEQRLDAPLPLDTALVDARGRPVRLGDYFGERPVVLAFVYFDCPMLCSLILQNVARAMKPLALEPGRDFELVVVSFDPSNTPADAQRQKTSYVRRYGREHALGLHFLTGTAAAVNAVTDAVGFHVRYDPKTDLFFHPAAIVIATPSGRVSRYLTGVEFAPRDLKFALMDASNSRIGTLVDHVQLFCYQYDPANGRYGLVVFRLLRGGAALTAGALIVLLAATWWREGHREKER